MPPKKRTPLRNKINRDVFFGTSADLPRVIEVEVAQLRPNPNQPRKSFNEEALQELATSIADRGLLQPIAVQNAPEGDGYFIVAGERRARAYQILERDTIPAIVTDGNPDELALIENLQRENLTPLEEAEALAGLMERHGYSQGDVAQALGKARTSVVELLKLTTLPEAVKEGCRTSDTLPKSVLLELARYGSESEQLALWEEIKGGARTVRAVREKRTSKPAPSPRSPVDTALSAGKRFLKEIDTLSAEEIAQSARQEELVELRDRLNAALAALPTNRSGHE